MSKWDDFKKSLGDLADMTASKTRELADTTSLKIKIANKEADRDAEYKILGKLMYAKLTSSNTSEELTVKISETMERLEAIIKELEELQAADGARKDVKAAKKEPKKENADTQNEKEPELNTEVMAQFNEARRSADEEYEKAKQAADEAR